MFIEIFFVPQKVVGDTFGYEFLSNLAGKSLGKFNANIIIDFQECTFFDGNLCAVLGNILQSLKDRNNTIQIINLSGKVRGAMGRNGFLTNFVSNINVPVIYHNSIPYRKFKLEDESHAKDFFKDQLFGKQDMPHMSPLAQKEIIRNIFEVCLNAVTHGGCEYVYCCGQVYLRKVPAKALITFADLGNSIKANVNNYLRKNLTGNEAIMWALADGNTTKTQDIPGGLGLKLLQNLIYLNKGKLQFVSGDGFVEIKDGNPTFFKLDIDFPGTIVTLELLLNDPNFYYLGDEDKEWTNIF